MLQAIRDKSSGVIATIILGLLIIPFAFFGMEQYLFQSSANTAAKIETAPSWWRGAPDWWPVRKLFWDKEEITISEFSTAFEQERQRRSQAEGEAFDSRAFASIDNKRKVLEGLIDARVMRMAVDRDGYAVGDEMVQAAIEADPAFQVDGKFDPQRYKLVLASAQPALTPKQYDQRVRDNLRQIMLADQLRRSAFVTPSEAQRVIGMLVETRDVSYITLPKPAADLTPIPAAEIARWYKEHPDDFSAPEQVTVEYVEVDASQLPPPAAPSEADLRKQYESEKKRFVEPEQRLTSHILVKLAPDADAAAQKVAESKANDLLKQVRAGADFSTLARSHSDDPGSRDNGGDLGWVSRGSGMVKSFEDGVMATAAGAVSAPIKSEFGWHIIKVREIKPEKGMSFEQARSELERLATQAARDNAYNTVAGKLVDEVQKSPSSLANAAKATNQSVRKAGPFARGEATGVLANPAVLRALFSEEMKTTRMASDPVRISDSHSVAVRVIDYKPERVRPLSEAGNDVVAAIRADRARKAIEADADTIVAKLNKGETLASIGSARKVAVINLPGVPRGAPAPTPQAAEAYFNVPAPAAGKLSAGKVLQDDGQVLVFAVTKTSAGKIEEIPAEQRTGFTEQMALRIGMEDVATVNKRLRGSMRVDVNEDRL